MCAREIICAIYNSDYDAIYHVAVIYHIFCRALVFVSYQSVYFLVVIIIFYYLVGHQCLINSAFKSHIMCKDDVISFLKLNKCNAV